MVGWVAVKEVKALRSKSGRYLQSPALFLRPIRQCHLLQVLPQSQQNVLGFHALEVLVC